MTGVDAPGAQRTGASEMADALACAGIEVCFANPGTTELRLLSALTKEPRIRTVLCLFEGVCTGAAGGYARMRGKAAATLLHLGPGLANGLANLHNARRARSPMLNIVGDHPTFHLSSDPPLASDIEGLASTVSPWTSRTEAQENVWRDTCNAIARTHNGANGIATLIVPEDSIWAALPARPPERRAVAGAPAALPADESVSRAQRALAQKRCGLLLDGEALSESGLRVAARIRRRTGVRLFATSFPARLRRGKGVPRVERVAYFPDQAEAQLANVETLLLAGAKRPVAFFAYPGKATRFAAHAEHLVLAPPGGCVVATLEALAKALGADADEAPEKPAPAPARVSGALTYNALGAIFSAHIPDNAIVCDEGVTASGPCFAGSISAPAHDWLTLCGGAIGQGLPLATGAAIACPDRPVLALQADGSALYTLQALWTQARENLNVTTVLVSNRQYKILRLETRNAGLPLNEAARTLTSLDQPSIDWCSLAQGFGVRAFKASTCEELAASLEQSLTLPGPKLIEAILPTPDI